MRVPPTPVLAFFAALCAPPAFPARSFPDADVADAVAVEISRSGFPSAARGVTVRVSDGVATLTGTVDSLLARRRSVELAKSVRGVRSVVDNIQVETSGRTDAQIKTALRKALVLNDAVDSAEVAGQVADGRVTLTGEVDSHPERLLAGEAAARISGVVAVNNLIAVRPDRVRPDGDIRHDVLGILSSDALLHEDSVRVSVKEGVVALAGTVGSMAEADRAELLAWVAGVRSVVNDLQVLPGLDDRHQKTTNFDFESDAELTRAVQRTLLHDARVPLPRPVVSVSSGVVTLSGTVPSYSAKRAAGQDARNTIGVVDVKNDVLVSPDPVRSDADLESDVAATLALDSLVGLSGIDVSVDRGAASLTGTVNSFNERRRAENLAAAVPGVVAVENRLAIRAPPNPVPDKVIAGRIEQQLFWSPYVDADDVDVSVNGGRATLKGTVDSFGEFEAAVQNAWEGGATDVAPEMRIDLSEAG